MPNASPKIRSTPAEHPLLGEHLWGTASVERILKGLSYKKLLFTVVKRNLLTLKNKQINENNKCPVIGTTSNEYCHTENN